MQRYVLMRTIQAVITVWFVSIAVFGLARLTGNPLDVLMPPEATPEDFARMEKVLGLDKPLPVQYWIFISNAVQGDFGESLRFEVPAIDVFFQRLPNTIQLAGISFLIAMAIAVPVGVYAARNRGSRSDNVVRGFAVVGQAMPHFWLGIMLILVFAVFLRLLPSSGKGGILYFILPAATIGYHIASGTMRLTRSAMLDVLDSEYIKLARAKGLREATVTWKHAARNAAIPVLTYASLTLIRMLIGSVVVETVFAWPGVGRLVIDAIRYRDFPIVQTVVIMLSVMFILGNLLVDILYAWADPKIRYRK
ncbi:ABC transporter permease [Chloroflexota bacterium]